MAADVDNDDDGSSGSSTRLNSVPSSVPIRRNRSTSNIFMPPFTRRAERPAERYPLHNTPERESRRSGVTSNKVAEERSAAKELQRMREQHAALLSSIEAQRAAQPLPEAHPPPPPQQPILHRQIFDEGRQRVHRGNRSVRQHDFQYHRPHGWFLADDSASQGPPLYCLHSARHGAIPMGL